MARGDHLWRHRWSRGPSIAAVLGLEAPSMVRKIATDGPGNQFWGDHWWHRLQNALFRHLPEFDLEVPKNYFYALLYATYADLSAVG